MYKPFFSWLEELHYWQKLQNWSAQKECLELQAAVFWGEVGNKEKTECISKHLADDSIT